DAGFEKGLPIGLYYMTRYVPTKRTLEKAAWYFLPDGRVYENIERGFSDPDLATHVGPEGKATVSGSRLEIIWKDGKKSSSSVEHEGAGFTWDMAIFSPARAFDEAGEITGIYEAAEPNQRLELKADGTFTWEGVSFVALSVDADQAIAAGGTTKGRWQLSGFLLTLTNEMGTMIRRIAFPCADEEKTPARPASLFFGGLMYQKK